MPVIKHTNSDFVVDEVCDLPLLAEGPFLIVRMRKEGKTTFDAIQLLAKRLHMSVRAIGYSGLKDKHGITTQHLSLANTVWADVEALTIPGIALSFVGYAANAVGLGSCSSNAFTILMRDLDTLPHPIDHLVNYYDEQRFGGARPNTHIIGKLLLLGDYERAAFEVICAHYPSERLEHQEMRMQLASLWPDIPFERIPAWLSTERRLMSALAKKNDYRAAFLTLPKRLLTLYVQSYQSFLFNKVLREHITERSNEIEILGEIFPVGPPTAQQLPLIGHDYQGDDPFIADILTQEGVGPEIFKARDLPGLSSRTILRNTHVPVVIKADEAEPDEFFVDRFKQRVQFTLPKGCYATMVIKQMF